MVLNPKICPPIFFKKLPSQVIKLPQGLHSPTVSYTVNIRVLSLIKKRKCSKAQSSLICLQTWSSILISSFKAFSSKLHSQNPNFDCLGGPCTVQPLGEFYDLAWQFLEEYGRANFGVQHHPLYLGFLTLILSPCDLPKFLYVLRVLAFFSVSLNSFTIVPNEIFSPLLFV